MNKMNPAKTDRRIQRTRTALRDAMLILLASKGWDELQIQEICDRANIGRSTFYMHFRGKDELLSESMNDLRDALAQQAATRHDPGLRFLGGLLEHMAEQREVFRSVIGRRSGHGVAYRFKEMLVQLVQGELETRHKAAAKKPMLVRFLAGGIVEAMSWWVDAPKRPSISELELKLNGLCLTMLSV